MAKDFEQRVDDLPTEAFSEGMRGIIVERDDGFKRKLWLGLGTIAAIMIIFSAWAYTHFNRTDEQLLKERLASAQHVKQMLSSSQQTIANHSTSRTHLEQAISTAIDVTNTPLKMGASRTAPFIYEREAAAVEALEGLLVMTIVFEDDPEHGGFTRRALNRLGEMKLSYYNSGIYEETPLIQSAIVRKSIAQHAQTPRNNSTDQIAELRERLTELEAVESDTLLTASLMLGKWYHYHNNRPMAKRCFDIGRRYIEGTTHQNSYYPGVELHTLSPLWSEYAKCLEALAEIAFSEQQYRVARSYLQRLFHTPDGTSPLDDQLLNSNRAAATRHQVSQLEHDIVELEKAIASPLTLPTYPLFAPGEDQIIWSELAAALKTARLLDASSLPKLLWDALSDSSRTALLEQQKRLITPDEEARIIAALNSLLTDPGLADNVPPSEQQLNAKAQQLWRLRQERGLQGEEIAIFNRGLIESSLPAVFRRDFRLSDGTYIHNGLSPKQTSQLLTLYQDRMLREPSDALRDKIEAIYQGEQTATVHDLHSELHALRTEYKQQITQAKERLTEQSSILGAIRRDTRQLEEAAVLDLDQLIAVKEEEEAVEQRQIQARIALHKSESELGHVEQELTDITFDLRQQLADAMAQLELHKNGPTETDIAATIEAKPQLAQIEKQLSLHSRYLQLLQNLQQREQNVELRNIHAQSVELSKRIDILRARRDASTGDTREVAERELSHLLTRQKELLDKFNSSFEPLREVVSEIADEEHQIWHAETSLRSAREEIRKLIGTDQIPGSLAERSKRRAQLVLVQPKDAEGLPLHEAEVRRLTEELAADYTRLHILLETERQAIDQLTTFYPHIKDQTGGSALASLQSYLQEQEKLMEQYQILWQQDKLQNEIQQQEKTIVDTMTVISTALESDAQLSEKQTLTLSRSVTNLFNARKRLSQLQHMLKELLTQRSVVDMPRESVSGRGFLLDSTEIFQIEHEMGLNLRNYRHTFEERRALVQELTAISEKRRGLEEDKLTALRRRDQRQVDLLLPKLADQERRFTALAKTLNQVDDRLRQLAKEYQSSQEQVQAYRRRLMPQLSELREEISSLDSQMNKNDQRLEDLSSLILDSQQEFDRVATSIGIDDLRGLDDLVERQQEIINHLTKVRSERIQEHYYQAKALFLMGRSLDQQARITEYRQMVEATAIPIQMLEDERRHGKKLVNEFNESITYESTFINAPAEEDRNRANLDIWIDQVEKQALDIFEQQLPVYTQFIAENEQTASEAMIPEMRWDIDAFIAKSRLMAGKLYVRRGMRQLSANRRSDTPNIQAIHELDLAGRAFHSLLRFTDGSGNRVITYADPADQAFPKGKRYQLEISGRADLYLGIIAAMKGNHLEAIEHYRTMLSRLDSTMKLDPIAETTLQYQLEVVGSYTSMLAHHPIAHEVLYRLGLSYEALGQEMDLRIKREDPTASKEQLTEYANKAAAYFSQLILTQSYSSFRNAAHLHRARAFKLVDNYEGARSDLVAILGDPTDSENTWQTEISAAGELLDDLNPSHAYVAFELGQLYLDQGDYDAAVETLELAKAGHNNEGFVTQAKIAYAKALQKSDKLLMAHLFLQELVDESQHAPTSDEHVHNPDLILDLAKVQQSLGNLSAAQNTLDLLFQRAPGHLHDGNRLDLTSQYGMALLQSDYRDLIRPLAEASELAGALALDLRDTDLARFHFDNGQVLHEIVPWHHDRVLRDFDQSEWEQYKHQHLLTCQWGKVKSDAEELLFSTLTHFRRAMETAESPTASALLDPIKRANAQASADAELYRELSDRVRRFYQDQVRKLPETIAVENVRNRQRLDSANGGEGMLLYRALSRLRESVMSLSQSSPTQLIESLQNSFGADSVEDSLLNEFAFEYARKIDLSEGDRLLMGADKSNLDNLAKIEDPEQRLAQVGSELKLWIEVQMQETGLDDLFVPLSPQGKILEEVALYQVALLALINDFDAYNALVDIVNDTITRSNSNPPQIQSIDYAWQMIELASNAAFVQEDWLHTAAWDEYLIEERRLPIFVRVDNQQLLSHKLSLATALSKLAQKDYQNMVFLYDEQERIKLQQQAISRTKRAEELLQELKNLEGTDARTTAMRVVSQKLLKEIGA